MFLTLCKLSVLFLIFAPMEFIFYKYQGAGNDFVMIDNRSLTFPKNNTELIRNLCDRRFGIGGDGLILLEPSKKYDFKMVYFNADGNEGSMCGNGGRCIVRFAEQLQIITQKTTFEATDGVHFATLSSKTVSLEMIEVNEVTTFKTHCFLNTGSPHHVEFCDNLKDKNIKKIGADIRYGAPYFKEGTNVNFAEQINTNTFDIRTYERGVEDETLACGTGATAVAIAAYKSKKTSAKEIYINALGGKLKISFDENNGLFSNVFLTGEATFVFKGSIAL